MGWHFFYIERKKNWILMLILFSTLINMTASQNATTCKSMYTENLTTVPCITNTTCCYLEYQYFGKNFTKCLFKLNETDNICDTLPQSILSFPFTNVNYCDCFSNWISLSNIKFALTFILIIIITIN